MGILDEAIREHLELKRQHGADDSELSKLEDEAFGQPERPGDEAEPDPAAEAPTEFMTAARERLRSPPPGASRRSPICRSRRRWLLPPRSRVDEAPAEEEQPAMEHEIVADTPEADEPEPEPVEEPRSPPTPPKSAT